MFNNLNWWNIAVLLLLALFIFGDKLPQAISDGLRFLRNLRRMARNATTDLSRELGTDIQLEDLHPKTFIRKHVLSEEDQNALLNPLRGVSEELAQEAKGLQQDLKDIGRSGDPEDTRGRAGARGGGGDGVRGGAGAGSGDAVRGGAGVGGGAGAVDTADVDSAAVSPTGAVSGAASTTGAARGAVKTTGSGAVSTHGETVGAPVSSEPADPAPAPRRSYDDVL